MGHAEDTEQRELGRRQELAIEALLAGANVTKAAETVGIGRASLYRWMKDPGFADALDHRRAELSKHNFERLRAMVPAALEVGTAVLESGKDSDRLRAAGMVLRGAGLLDGTAAAPSPPEPRSRFAGWSREEKLRFAEEGLIPARVRHERLQGGPTTH